MIHKPDSTDTQGVQVPPAQDKQATKTQIDGHHTIVESRLHELITQQAGAIAERDMMFQRLSAAFVSLGVDYKENINILTSVCGDLLNSTCCLYSRQLDDGMLHVLGKWKAPEDLLLVDKPDGHLCHDVIKCGGGTHLFSDLQNSEYLRTDPNVAPYGLQTYLGHAVYCNGKSVGSLCVVFQEDKVISTIEHQILALLSTAVGIEEDRWRSQLKIKTALEEAEQGNRAKTMFLGTMSHEIRTPLTGILGYAELLLSTTTDQEVKQGLEVIKNSGITLLEMINNVLDYARIDQQRAAYKCAPADVRDLIMEVIAVRQPEIEASGLELITDLPDGEIIVETDAGRFRQVLCNLLGNAIKFTEEGGIKVVGGIVGDSLELSILDTGCGFSPENSENIFLPFFQEQNDRTSKHSGTGLGLAISKKIIECLGGSLTATSEVGKGSEFHISMPVGCYKGASI